ncbi:MAG: 3D-(3,5/4)-trihydroxycyclohexane-1,2-dione acylhydrolase (decyclizing) [Pseudomonadota bacterium]
MNTERLTVGQALVRHLVVQEIEHEDGSRQPLFGGAFAIFGHGNVASLGEALYAACDKLPTWRGQNEQSMALAAVAYAKANLRRQIAIATSSIGPGAANMVTAAGVAHSNRLPLLLLAGDTFTSRLPDPVLQQVEHFHSPSTTVNDAFRAVSRFWDRIDAPDQLLQSLPQAIDTMLDPADCGPAFLGLPQDVQAHAFDCPVRFLEPRVHRIRRARADRADIVAAAEALKQAKRPLIIAGGGIHYSHAAGTVRAFAEKYGVPVAETIAGRGTVLADHPLNVGPMGPTGFTGANDLAGDADAVLAIGTRLQDFITGSWTVFGDDDLRLIAINVGRFDARKHNALSVIGDARETVTELDEALGDWRAPAERAAQAKAKHDDWLAGIETRTAPSNTMPSYAQVVGLVNKLATPADRLVTAAGGLPAEVNSNWRPLSEASVDVEFGFSCMGYEIAGGWGAAIARKDSAEEGDVIVLVGDGSYLIMNSDIYSSVLSGHKMIIVVCDNEGFAVIDKLQRNTGNESFNNLLRDCKGPGLRKVDFAAHAAALGAQSETVTSIADLEAAFGRARAADETYVISIEVDKTVWTDGASWWEVGVPEVSDRPSVEAAAAQWDEGRRNQRRGY